MGFCVLETSLLCSLSGNLVTNGVSLLFEVSFCSRVGNHEIGAHVRHGADSSVACSKAFLSKEDAKAAGLFCNTKVNVMSASRLSRVEQQSERMKAKARPVHFGNTFLTEANISDL